MPPKVSNSTAPVAKKASAAPVAPKASRKAPPGNMSRTWSGDTREATTVTPRQSAPPKTSATPKQSGTPPKASTARGHALGSTVSAPGTAAAKRAAGPDRAVTKAPSKATTATPPITNTIESIFSDSDDDVIDSAMLDVTVVVADADVPETTALEPQSLAQVETLRREHAEAKEQLEEELRRLQLENAELRKGQEDLEAQRAELSELRASCEEIKNMTAVMVDLQTCREELDKMQKENATLRKEVSELGQAGERAKELQHELLQCENSKKELQIVVQHAMDLDQRQHSEMIKSIESSLQDLAAERYEQATAHGESLQKLETQLEVSEDWWRSLVEQIRSEIVAIHEDNTKQGGVGLGPKRCEIGDEPVANGRRLSESLTLNSRKSVTFHDSHECISPKTA